MDEEERPAAVGYPALIREVSRRERVSMRDARRIVDATVAVILDNAGAGRPTAIALLGTFRPSRGTRAGSVAFRPSAAKRRDPDSPAG